MRLIVDTSVLVSALIRPQGVPGQFLSALREGRFTLLYSTTMLVEVIDVLGRAPFRNRYQIQPEDITALIDLVRLRGELVNPERRVTACRDPKDNKFLEIALEGLADAVVSGDEDLLTLTPFEGIAIVRPVEFVARL